MTQVEISKSLLKKAYNEVSSDLQDMIDNQVPDLFDNDGWLIDVTDEDVAANIRELSEGISEPPPSVGAQDTRLIEPMLKLGRGEENGHGLYLHRRGGYVSWCKHTTKKNKAVLLVPVKTGSKAEQILIDLGYTKI